MKRELLKSVCRGFFADEIIVVDSGSQDGNGCICEKFGAQVFTINLKAMARRSHLLQRQEIIGFYTDADEILNDELIAAIIKAIQQNKEIL
jgi:glycosyltransferase involved in cell wall biosynthesis